MPDLAPDAQADLESLVHEYGINEVISELVAVCMAQSEGWSQDMGMSLAWEHVGDWLAHCPKPKALVSRTIAEVESK